MTRNIFIAVRLTVVCLLTFSGFYTLFIWGLALLTPDHGQPGQWRQDGRSYFSNIGQRFSEDRYFYSRPSAVNYDAGLSGGSNKGPSNPAYLADVESRIDSFLVHNPGVERREIPAELVTASGSGLDPDISVAAAMVQLNRISRVRNIPVANLHQLVISATEPPLLGCLGPSKINVLKLNLSLDNLK